MLQAFSTKDRLLRSGSPFPMLGASHDYDFVNDRYFPFGDPATLFTTTRNLSAFAGDMLNGSAPFLEFGANVFRRSQFGFPIEFGRATIQPHPLSMSDIGPNPPNTAVTTTDIPPLFPNMTVYKHTLQAFGGDTNCGAIANMTGWSLSSTYTVGLWVWIPPGGTATAVALKQEQSTAPWSNTSIGSADMNKRSQWQFVKGQVVAGGAGTANPNMVLRITDTQNGFVVYSTGWDFQFGVFPTTPIDNATATTRPSDIVLNTAGISLGSAVSVLAEIQAMYSTNAPFIFQFDDGTNGNSLNMRYQSNDSLGVNKFIGGVNSNMGGGAGSLLTGTIVKGCVMVDAANYNFVSAGALIGSGTAALPSNMTIFRLGHDALSNVGGVVNLRRLTVFPSLLSVGRAKELTI